MKCGSNTAVDAREWRATAAQRELPHIASSHAPTSVLQIPTAELRACFPISFGKSPALPKHIHIHAQFHSTLPYHLPHIPNPNPTPKMSSSFPPPELREIILELAPLLKERKETISVAETVRSSYALSHSNPPPPLSFQVNVINDVKRQQAASSPPRYSPSPAPQRTTAAALRCTRLNRALRLGGGRKKISKATPVLRRIS